MFKKCCLTQHARSFVGHHDKRDHTKSVINCGTKSTIEQDATFNMN